MTCNLRTVKNFTDRTNCTDRKEIAPLYDFTSKDKNIPSVANDMQLKDRKLFLTNR